MAEDELQFDLGMPKKKKKKKKFVLGELESDLHALQAQTEEHEHVEDTATVAPEVRPTPDTTEKAPVPDEDEELKELMNTKKKRKKKEKPEVLLEAEVLSHDEQVPAVPAADTVEETVVAEIAKEERSYEVIMDFDLPKKKKRRRTDITFEGFDEAVLETAVTLGTLDVEPDDDIEMKDGENNMMENEELLETTLSTPWVGTERDYTYEELLERVFNIMREKNPNAGGPPKKLVMKPPQVVRVGAKKTSFVNFTEICKFLHRQPKHLLEYLMAELGTSGSVDGNNQLIIKGRFQQKQIETVLRRYIKEYVTCHTCRSPSTILQKETRLFFLQCETCGSRCSVQSIKSGFQAVTGHRAQLRQRQQ